MNRPARSSVAELKRYDPDLGIRYSPEKKKWAITRKVMPIMRDGIPRPVRRVPRPGGGFDEIRKDPQSELALNWRDKTAVIGYVKHLTKESIREVFRMDGWRRGNSINNRIAKLEEQKEKQYAFERKDRSHAAYDFLRSGWRRNIMSD